MSSPWVNIRSHTHRRAHTPRHNVSLFSFRLHLACRQNTPTQLRPSSSVLVSLLELWSSATTSSSCGPGCLFGCWRPLMSTGRTRDHWTPHTTVLVLTRAEAPREIWGNYSFNFDSHFWDWPQGGRRDHQTFKEHLFYSSVISAIINTFKTPISCTI